MNTPHQMTLEPDEAGLPLYSKDLGEPYRDLQRISSRLLELSTGLTTLLGSAFSKKSLRAVERSVISVTMHAEESQNSDKGAP